MMSEGYGEHCERLAGYGVGSGELRDYESFSLEEAETVEGNSQEGQTSICPNCGFDQDGQFPTHCLDCGWPLLAQPAVNVAPSSAIPEDAEEINLSGGVIACEKETGFHRQKVNAGRNRESLSREESPAQNIPADAEASLTEWYDEVERNQRENERDQEEAAWHEQEVLQNETDA